jgi:TP901 family phage tail tape measure protein
MKKLLTALITLKAVDKMSSTVNRAYGNAQSKLSRLSRSSDRVAKKSTAIASSAGIASLGMAAALSVPVQKAIQFEQAMADVGAVMANVTGPQMEALNKQARHLGATTQFTATQAAEAMGFLAMAGFDATQTMEAMPSMLNLSAAGALDLAKTADIASNVLTGFGLEANQMTRVADALTAGFTSTNTDLVMLGETMKFAAPIASKLNLSLEDTVAIAGMLGDAGIQGSMGGTAVRTSLLRLAGPLRKGEKALKKYGIATLDLAGNVKPVPTLFAEIGNKLDALPSGAKMAALRDIFGTEATSAAAVFLNQKRNATLQDYIAKLQEAKTAEQVAAARMATTNGEILKLNSAYEDAMITIGLAFLPMLVKVAQKAAAVATAISTWAQANPKLFKTLAKIVLVVGAVISAIAVVATVVAAVSSAVGFMATVFSVVGTVIGFVSGVVATIIPFISALAAGFTFLTGIAALPFVLVAAAIAAAAFLIYKYWDQIQAFFVKLGPKMLSAGKSIVNMIGQGIKFALTGPLSPFGLMKANVKKIRDLLPFSPAKTGPLRDIHRIKLVETIAGSIKSKPLVSAMTGVVGDVANMSGARPALSPSSSGGGAINAPITVTFNGAVSENDKMDFRKMLETHKADLARMMGRINNDTKRLAY